MKQYILSGVALLALLLPSCSEDRLEVPQKGVVDYSSFYTAENAENAATFVYQTTMYGLWDGIGGNDWVWQGAIWVMQEAPSDEVYWASGNKSDHVSGLILNEFRPTLDENFVTTKVSYTAFYNMIRGCNQLLDEYQYNMIEDNPDLNAVVNRCVSEAKVARAFAHFNLAIYWGNPPLVDKTLQGSDKPSNTPHDEILDWCIAELDEAAQYLPSKANQGDQAMTCRFTKEFAYALKGKVEVFAEKYDDAQADLKKVIDSDLYDLVEGPDMWKLYHVAGDLCKEWVFQFNFVDDDNIGYFDGMYSYHFVNATSWRYLENFPTQVVTTGWGSVAPSESFAKGLIENDGMDSWRRQSWIVTYDELINGKEINGETILSYDDYNQPYALRGVAQNRLKNGGVFGNAGFWQLKRIPFVSEIIKRDYLGTNMGSEVNYPIMRYTEVLLLYAEACAQTGKDLDKGLECLKKIQERANSKHISSECSLAEVKNEKRWESFLEGSRYADLVRWGDAYEVMKDQGGKVPSLYDNVALSIRDSIAKAEQALDPKWTWEGPDSIEVNGKKVPNPEYPLENWRKFSPYFKHVGNVKYDSYNGSDGTGYGFKQNKHELMPYPYSALSVNPNLVQNQGY